MDGMISYSGRSLGENTVATYTCQAWYALTTDATNRTCDHEVVNNEGVWSGSDLVCGRYNYGILLNIQSMTLIISQGRPVKTSLIYKME